MAEVIKQLVDHFDYEGPSGLRLSYYCKARNVCKSPGNLHKSWLGVLILMSIFTKTTGHEFTVLNDADAAGYASMNYGVAGKGKRGLCPFYYRRNRIGQRGFF